ncbi:MAG: septum formation protein Maf [Lachnospiraceae bacterium]|nr:septum formation protein Maf [Lachnospiraceae bacterium]
MYQFILASQSPRRRELLEQIGMSFTCIPSQGEEYVTSTDPETVVKMLSEQKAKEIAGTVSTHNTVIIGADTIVSYGNEILGKPKDESDAFRMLDMLQGNVHQVYTGVTLIIRGKDTEEVVTFAEKTEVSMYPMNQKQMMRYIASGEPMDKAGAYAIQGKCAAYIEKINGDYNNVVGLPVSAICRELYIRGIDFL